MKEAKPRRERVAPASNSRRLVLCLRQNLKLCLLNQRRR
jgi:hypothetical protein